MRNIVVGFALLISVTGCKTSPNFSRDEAPLLPPPVVTIPIPAPPAPPLIESPDAEKPKNQRLTIVQGTTSSTLFKSLQIAKGVTSSTPPLTADTIKETLGIQSSSLEGLFLPDTYRFAEGTNDLDLLGLANARLNDELERAWNSRDPSLPINSPYELLILASIVEKETALEREAPIIAGVFVTRLKKGMRLQSDPTVIYGMGARYTGRMMREDLRRDTPHNTYTRDGLPPTPICLPSLGSIRAAANPQLTGAIFFVISDKRDGSHYFSKTLKEHNAAVRRYLDALRKK